MLWLWILQMNGTAARRHRIQFDLRVRGWICPHMRWTTSPTRRCWLCFQGWKSQCRWLLVCTYSDLSKLTELAKKWRQGQHRTLGYPRGIVVLWWLKGGKNAHSTPWTVHFGYTKNQSFCWIWIKLHSFHLNLYSLIPFADHRPKFG